MSENIASGRSMTVNSVLNLLTGVVVIALNIAFVPLLIHAFGTQLFAVLSVTWMILANLAWLDLGFSRAAARFVAQELAVSRPDRAAVWAWTAILAQLALGLVGGVGLLALAPKLTMMLKIDPRYRDVVTLALRLFAFSIPLDLAVRSLSGILQARQRFGWLNGLNLFGTFWTFGAYGLGILRGGDFLSVILGLFALRIVNLVLMATGAARVLPEMRRLPRLIDLVRDYRSNVRTMVAFGWWVSLAALFGAVLLYFDQWVIGGVIGAAVLPFYTVPVSMLGRLAIISSSLTSTLFPAFSALHKGDDWAKIEDFFLRSHRYVLAIVTPIMFLAFVWGGEFLRLWISAAFAEQATGPLRILCLGMTVALLAPISGSLLEAIGRPEVVAKLYMVELPLNLALVYALTVSHGVVGAAWSFTIRAIVETVAIIALVYRISSFRPAGLCSRPNLLQLLCTSLVAVVAVFLSRDAKIHSLGAVTASLGVLIAYTLACLWLIVPDERHLLAGNVAGRIRRRLAPIIDTMT